MRTRSALNPGPRLRWSASRRQLARWLRCRVLALRLGARRGGASPSRDLLRDAGPSQARSGVSGMTVMELMIVLAIIGGAAFLMRTGFRALTKADLVENSTDLAAVMKRASQLAVEHGALHRVVIDLDKGVYSVEVCEGQVGIQRNELVRPDEDAKKRALEKGKDKLQSNTDQSSSALLGSDPEVAAHRAMAIAGHHIADKTCVPVPDPTSGDAEGKGFIRQLRV